jgi:hypothetical protein
VDRFIEGLPEDLKPFGCDQPRRIVFNYPIAMFCRNGLAF